MPNSSKHIFLFSDSCGDQNKNSTITQFLLFLTMVVKYLNVKIQHIFPVKGNSYVCDRNFGMYSRVVRRREKVETMLSYVQISRKSRTQLSRFDLIHFQNFWNWSNALNPFFFRPQKNKYVKIHTRKFVYAGMPRIYWKPA